MNTPSLTTNAYDFSHAKLPIVNKQVFRMGIAGNYGINSSDVLWASDRGANYWICGQGYGKVAQGIREVIQKDRDAHVVAMLGWGFAGFQVRHGFIDLRHRVLFDLGFNAVSCTEVDHA